MALVSQQLPPAAVHDLQFAGQGLSFSPYEPGRLAVETAANFGIVGNGRLVVVLVVSAPGGGLALQPLGRFETNDGLYDVAWSEAHVTCAVPWYHNKRFPKKATRRPA